MTRDEFMRKWGVSGMPMDKIKLANAAWDEAEREIVRLRDQVNQIEKKLSDALAAYKRDVEDICP